jgi:TonB family protein
MRRIGRCNSSAPIFYYFSNYVSITVPGLIVLWASLVQADQKTKSENNKPPWSSDVVWTVMPRYPRYPHGLHGIEFQEGSGIFRLSLDLKTGRVIDVTVVKSTGHSTLDGSAIEALRQWALKPGKWKQIDVPVKFAIPRSSGRGDVPPSGLFDHPSVPHGGVSR